jgi:hypothetical protein
MRGIFIGIAALAGIAQAVGLAAQLADIFRRLPDEIGNLGRQVLDAEPG